MFFALHIAVYPKNPARFPPSAGYGTIFPKTRQGTLTLVWRGLLRSKQRGRYFHWQQHCFRGISFRSQIRLASRERILSTFSWQLVSLPRPYYSCSKSPDILKQFLEQQLSDVNTKKLGLVDISYHFIISWSGLFQLQKVSI
ncbi:hypothetical protein M378DRAFT_436986 [Amanita muscaria Koide BX008]|uniref:Uncharacterized protein n=1 Tax=Amanita muscaria (strain Koide BX008) TaxID=946122 RepID=A0A0C2WKX4_AMAMK|nr:hypothetical protein M378DRAFT_436986 [Amanita muscaria Koide BX008]